MMQPMRKILQFAVLFVMAMLPLPAVDITTLQPQGYVNDFASVLSPQTVARINSYCNRVESATGAQIAIVTVQTLDGDPIEDAANALYRRWGIGKKGSNEGVLLLLSIRDRRSRVEVGYGLEPYIPDGFAGSVLRSMRPALRANDYDSALEEGARTLGETIAKAKNVQISDAPERRTRRHSSEGFPWHAIIIAIIAVLVVSRLGGSGRGGGGGGGGGFLMGMLLGQVLSGGSRTRGGGGFGGYDSGDSFGGFGGGDSGGGGASSDW